MEKNINLFNLEIESNEIAFIELNNKLTIARTINHELLLKLDEVRKQMVEKRSKERLAETIQEHKELEEKVYILHI
jgi:hypothetical protein